MDHHMKPYTAIQKEGKITLHNKDGQTITVPLKKEDDIVKKDEECKDGQPLKEELKKN